jgi:hypothetical protein
MRHSAYLIEHVDYVTCNSTETLGALLPLLSADSASDIIFVWGRWKLADACCEPWLPSEVYRKNVSQDVGIPLAYQSKIERIKGRKTKQEILTDFSQFKFFIIMVHFAVSHSFHQLLSPQSRVRNYIYHHLIQFSVDMKPVLVKHGVKMSTGLNWPWNKYNNVICNEKWSSP